MVETKDEKTEIVRALDRETGEELWNAGWPGAMLWRSSSSCRISSSASLINFIERAETIIASTLSKLEPWMRLRTVV